MRIRQPIPHNMDRNDITTVVVPVDSTFRALLVERVFPEDRFMDQTDHGLVLYSPNGRQYVFCLEAQ